MTFNPSHILQDLLRIFSGSSQVLLKFFSCPDLFYHSSTIHLLFIYHSSTIHLLFIYYSFIYYSSTISKIFRLLLHYHSSLLPLGMGFPQILSSIRLHSSTHALSRFSFIPLLILSLHLLSPSLSHSTLFYIVLFILNYSPFPYTPFSFLLFSFSSLIYFAFTPQSLLPFSPSSFIFSLPLSSFSLTLKIK